VQPFSSTRYKYAVAVVPEPDPRLFLLAPAIFVHHLTLWGEDCKYCQ
jgi:hypothetical protein